MNRLLVTGASGFLGWYVCHLARQNWQVYGTYWTHPPSLPDVTLLGVDLQDFAALKQLFIQVQPTAVIHTAAQSKPNLCQLYPTESHAINVTTSCNIAGLCADLGIPCVFTSTDLVFDGLHAPYKELDPVAPVNLYGEQKVLAEGGMQERYPQSAICRMPLMFGASTGLASSFLQPFVQTLREGKELRLFTDEYRTPVSVTAAALGLLLAVEQRIEGYLHLGGKERLSRYEFGCLMAEVLDLPTQGLVGCRQQDVPMPAPRPPDVTMDSSKAFALGYSPGPLREELAVLRGQV